MRSLRARLVLGFALAALVPLGLAMAVLSQRIQRSVRSEASDRLQGTLSVLRARIRGDAGRIERQLRLLGGDPQLKRLYLVEAQSDIELARYVAERRVLLGLDFLEVANPDGAVVADAAEAPAATPEAAPAVPSPARPGLSPGVVLLPMAGDSSLAMAAAAPIPYRGRTVGFVSGGVVLDRALLERLRRSSGVDLVLRAADGHVVASTLPGVARRPLPVSGGVAHVALGGGSYLGRGLELPIGPVPRAAIVGLVSTAAADRAIATLRVTTLVIGLVALALAVAFGVLWSGSVSRPVERLAAFSERIAHGDWDEPLAVESVRELETLVAALDRMRADLRDYRERLVASERQAAWSQMARTVAHEVKNPLTPIAVSIADLKRSYDQHRPDFPEVLEQAVRTIGEEVATLKRLLGEFSEFGRFPAPRPGPCRLEELLADLRTLYGRELSEGLLTVAGADPDVAFHADRGQIRQALVNLVKNGLEAVEGRGHVRVTAGRNGDRLEFAVADDGPGLSAEQRARLFVPEFTTKAAGSGLGLTIVQRIANEHGGSVSVDSDPGRGTTFRLRLPLARGA